jgi:hypothetical protein
MRKWDLIELVRKQEEQLERMAPEFRQLTYMALAESSLELAGMTFGASSEDWKNLIVKSCNNFLCGLKYKQTPLASRFPNGKIKVNDTVMNPRRAFRALSLSCLSNNKEQAEQIAALIWDPPFAEYIGLTDVCTQDEQRVAHAFRDLILKNLDKGTLREDLASIPDNRSGASLHKAILEAIAERDLNAFEGAIKELVELGYDESIYGNRTLFKFHVSGLISLGKEFGKLQTDYLINTHYLPRFSES